MKPGMRTVVVGTKPIRNDPGIEPCYIKAFKYREDGERVRKMLKEDGLYQEIYIKDVEVE